MKCVQKHFWREHLYAFQIFLGAIISRPVCARTCTQLRGNIGDIWEMQLKTDQSSSIWNLFRTTPETCQ